MTFSYQMAQELKLRLAFWMTTTTMGLPYVRVFLVICILHCDWGFRNLTEVFLTLTEVFPCFFVSCKANARVKLSKTGHGQNSSNLVVICVQLLFVLFYVFSLCKCVLYSCHRVTTQLQLTYIYKTLTQRAYTASYNYLIHVAAHLPIRRLLSIKMSSFDAGSVIRRPTLSKGSVPQTFM